MSPYVGALSIDEDGDIAFEFDAVLNSPCRFPNYIISFRGD